MIIMRFVIINTGSIWRLIAPLPLLALAWAPTAIAGAQPSSTAFYANSVTLYGGGRFGGSLTDPNTNTSIDLRDGSSFGLAVDIGVDRSRQVELFYSQQDTALTSGAFSPQSGNVGLTLRNFHFGGTAFIDEIGTGVYVMGGIGGTTVTPKATGLNSETFLSGNLGVGWMLSLSKHVGVRFEARGYGLLLNGSGSLFCGGAAGCTAAVKGQGLFYAEVLLGVTAKF
jgi:Outer membrane protein beta-barrel domain